MENSKTRNLKTLFINSAISVAEAYEVGGGRATLFTNFGWVVGKIREIMDIDPTDRDSLKKVDSDDVLSVVAGFARTSRKEDKEIGIKHYNENNVIFLKDVTIFYAASDQTIKTNNFALFADQVVGVMPADITKPSGAD